MIMRLPSDWSPPGRLLIGFQFEMALKAPVHIPLARGRLFSAISTGLIISN